MNMFHILSPHAPLPTRLLKDNIDLLAPFLVELFKPFVTARCRSICVQRGVYHAATEESRFKSSRRHIILSDLELVGALEAAREISCSAAHWLSHWVQTATRFAVSVQGSSFDEDGIAQSARWHSTSNRQQRRVQRGAQGACAPPKVPGKKFLFAHFSSGKTKTHEKAKASSRLFFASHNFNNMHPTK